MKTIIIIIFGILYSSLSYSQSFVSYTYINGYRVSRVIVIPPSGSARMANDSIANNGSANDSLAIAKLPETENIYSEVFDKRTITIYPNPTKGVLAIDISSTTEVDNISLLLFDLQGKQIYSEVNFKGKSEINFTNSPPVTYLLKLILNGQEIVWTVIKQ